MARHCRPQKPTHQIAMIALRKRRPRERRLRPGSCRPGALRRQGQGRKFGQHFVYEGVDVGERIHDAGDIFAGRTAVPICGWLSGC
jgi:hypothetical protein